MPERQPPKGEEIEAQLRAGKLPKMVDWFDPIILAQVGVRTLISSTIGQYADQRPMQAALDSDDTPDQLARRHDFSDLTVKEGNTSLKLDDRGSLWVDFIADLGDGFEATYALAYLMAASNMTVEGLSKAEGRLPGGEILILGGDLAYPNATVKEYQDRCIAPYDLAFQTGTPKRKLFFIAGNHDWYDGLVAFTSVFCAARDRYSKGLGKQIGGWQCHQRRSYFGLKLPYDWWIWGIDVGLTDTVDDAQREYFRVMAEYTKSGDKVILITHAPDWLKHDTKSMIEMTALARSKGADVTVWLAGDLHHYTRYSSADCGVELITSGGGGAFLHPTHQLPRQIGMQLPVPTKTKAIEAVSDTAAPALPPGAVMSLVQERPLRQLASTAAGVDASQSYAAESLYPTRFKSRVLAAANLALPFRNRRLAVMIGIVYMVCAWAFFIAIADPTEAIKKAQLHESEARCISLELWGLGADKKALCRTIMAEAVDNELGGIQRRHTLAGLAKLETYLEGQQKLSPKEKDALQKYRRAKETEFAVKDEAFPTNLEHGGVGEFAKNFVPRVLKEAKDSWSTAVWIIGDGRPVANSMINPKRILTAMLDNIGFFVLMLGLWAGLVSYVDFKSKRKWLQAFVALVLGSLHFAAHVYIMLGINMLAQYLIYVPWLAGTPGAIGIVTGLTLYTLFTVTIGGILGSLVLGIYWVLTSIFGNMHMEAFSALGMKGYKNFLRMRFDTDGRLTIFAIGLDKVPGRRGWRATSATDAAQRDHNPALVPNSPLSAHLIETVVIAGRRQV